MRSKYLARKVTPAVLERGVMFKCVFVSENRINRSWVKTSNIHIPHYHTKVSWNVKKHRKMAVKRLEELE